MEPTEDAAAAGAPRADARARLSAESLVELYSGTVYRLALSLTRSPADAEDLAQDALIRAIRGLAGFKGDSDPKTWLHRITLNTWKNRVRSEKRRSFWSHFSLSRPEEDEEAPALELADGAPSLDQGLEASEQDSALKKALAGLDPEDRAILTLRELEGRSYEEIAKTLALPVGTVRSRLSRARETLRARMQGYLHGT